MDAPTSDRLRELLRAPAGCLLLLKMAHVGMTPREAAEPPTALHLVAQAVGELSPWSVHHDRLVDLARREARHHLPLAHALVREPGIARWWAPLDRDRQVWMEPASRAAFPTPEAFPTPTRPPTRWEHYAQKPERHVVTSTAAGDWTAQLAAIADGASDWTMICPARRKRVRVSPAARVAEIVTAEDWHALVITHGARSDPERSFSPDSWRGQPWGPNDGLIPDWRSVAREWDGVHLTTWAVLTATQVRIASDAGWTELWSREGEETTWLHWAFDAVDDMPPVDPLPEGRLIPSPPYPESWHREAPAAAMRLHASSDDAIP